MVGSVVRTANIQYRDGVPMVAAAVRRLRPWLCHLVADGGYAGEKLRTALTRLGSRTLEVVRRSDRAEGFVVLPKRWMVERTFA